MVQCQSCGHESSKEIYCELCGAALPQAAVADDDALSLMLGLVCERCDSYNDPGTPSCTVCQAPFVEGADAPPPAPAAASSPPSWMAAPEGKPLATAQAMPAVDLSVVAQAGPAGLAAPAPAVSSEARTSAKPAAAAACAKCGGDLLAGDKFCRHCGNRTEDQAAAPAPTTAPAAAAQKAAATMLMAAVPGNKTPASAPVAATQFMPQVQAPAGRPSATQFFGAASVERYARLILVKGHTQFGTLWRLQGGNTLIGRNAGAVIFPDDKHLADKHCRLELRGDELWVVPEQTTNGVFVQVRGRAPLAPGGEVICGSQRFRALPDDERPPVLHPDATDTKLYGSLATALNLVVMRVSADPRLSEVYARPQRILSVGRAGCDLNFPTDPFLSTRHAQLGRDDDGGLYVEDLGSRNGTFLRIEGERKLAHGDAIMLGEQVMRVELSLGFPR